MADIRIHFSDFFSLEPAIVHRYGAFDISLIADAPVFIDPFRLYASENAEYRELHRYIIQYLCFLKGLCSREKCLSKGVINRFFRFPEVRNLYMGFSKTGNCGNGLGGCFAQTLQANFRGPLKSFGEETISESSHLEKLCVVSPRIGRDYVSDFAANLLKGHLLNYTQDFARQYLRTDQCATFGVDKVVFDFEKQDWRCGEFYLPIFNDEYVLLAPRDILTRDETWISHKGLLNDLRRLPETIGNASLRGKLEDLISSIASAGRRVPERERRFRFNKFIQENIEIADWYIKNQEEHKADALVQGNLRVEETERTLFSGTRDAAKNLAKLGFYNCAMTCSEEVRKRIGFFKKFIEDNDGYRLFFDSYGRKVKEELVQLAFRLLWYGSSKDVNREVNNGRGPCDFKISFGNGDKCVIEIKWASNRRGVLNLAHQTDVYARANDTSNRFAIVLYVNEHERRQMMEIIRENRQALGMEIVLIDASPKKVSASKIDVPLDVGIPRMDLSRFDFSGGEF